MRAAVCVLPAIHAFAVCNRAPDSCEPCDAGGEREQWRLARRARVVGAQPRPL